jgi:uncharacterized Rossmann fold enzyme
MISFIREKTTRLIALAPDLFVKLPVKQPRLRLVTMATNSKSRKYSKKASSKVGRAMHEMKRGKLKSGKSGKKVKSRKQAIAIGLSEARKSGAKVPSR